MSLVTAASVLLVNQVSEKQSVQLAADDLVMQQRGLVDGRVTVRNTNTLDQLISGGCGIFLIKVSEFPYNTVQGSVR